MVEIRHYSRKGKKSFPFVYPYLSKHILYTRTGRATNPVTRGARNRGFVSEERLVGEEKEKKETIETNHLYTPFL